MRAHNVVLPEVEFAVKVGFLTKALWKEFFAYGGIRWQQKLWRQFRVEEIFRSRSEWPDLYLPNFQHPMVKSIATYLAKPPVLNQIAHDELVARTFLLLTRQYPGLETKTEALLKRESPLYNRGRKIRDIEKHPDLVVTYRGDKIAIEIELNQKSKARYEAIFRSYRRAGYSRILYVIRSEATKLAIKKASKEVQFPTDVIPLGFGSIANWKIDPSRTPIDFGRGEILLGEILRQGP